MTEDARDLSERNMHGYLMVCHDFYKSHDSAIKLLLCFCLKWKSNININLMKLFIPLHKIHHFEETAVEYKDNPFIFAVKRLAVENFNNIPQKPEEFIKKA